MDPSRILGCTEECSGSRDNESGWTTYIASRTQQNHHHDDGGYNLSTGKQADHRNGNHSKDDDSESDDSMASDASSGPSHQEFQCTSNKKSVGSKHAAIKYSSREKFQEQIKQREEPWPRTKLIKQELVLDARSATSHIHGGTKVSKTKKCS
ncbi:hypothetical protein JCGZ_11808 [Jatropha curcas]|uniref:Uncharacterized protein n=1 Tax=Jatropha curcas TaxID=180498 RepID=A0A067K5N1_JATCU|nr:uncharacterized protein LOC119370602 [Jatropha curcas]KDP31432.1 hypothetical protein JCGZ_11808 [Jatropha curcas]